MFFKSKTNKFLFISTILFIVFSFSPISTNLNEFPSISKIHAVVSQQQLDQTASILTFIQSIINKLKIDIHALFGNKEVKAQADITTGLVGHWKFDEGAGTTASDSSGNNNTGTLTNGPTWTTGKIGGALSFDGMNDYVNIFNSPSLNNITNGATFSFWIKLNNYPTDSYRFIFTKGNSGYGSTDSPYNFLLNTNGAVSFNIFVNNIAQNISSINPISLNSFVHIVGTFDAQTGQQKIYFNNTQANSLVNSLGIINNNNVDFKISDVFGGERNIAAIIDDFYIYNHALTQTEITELYNFGSGTLPPSDTTPPVLSSGSPTGALPSGTTQTTLSVEATDASSPVSCKYSQTPGTAYSSIAGTLSTVNGTTFTTTVTGLTNGTSYNYYVRCQDVSGNANTTDYTISFSVASPVVSDTQAPTIPTGLIATAVSSSQINLSWTASTDNIGVTGYRIYRNSSQIATITAASYSDTGLAPSTTYSYGIAAIDGAGNSSLQSASASATTLAASANPIDNLKPGEWYEVPNSHLSAVLPVPTPGGMTGPESIMGAWSGGAYDTLRDRLMVWGGGHGDYPGNEIYAFDINTLKWIRLTNPSSPSGINNEYNTDGTPTSRHTYSSLVYMPNVDRMFARGGSLWQLGDTSRKTWFFDPNTNSWAEKIHNPTTSGLTVIGVYDPLTGHVFYHGWSALVEYDPMLNIFTKRSSDQEATYDGNGFSAALDTKRRRLIMTQDSPSAKVFAYDLTPTGIMPQLNLTTTGATEILTAKTASGLEYNPVTDQYVAWAGGADVYTLNPDTLVWTKHPTTSIVIPTQAPIQGTYGRWRYIPSKNVFIGVNSINENVWIYKLSLNTSDIIPPTVTITSPTSGSTISDSITISATASDNVSVAGVQFKIDGVTFGTEGTTAPYSITWNTATATNGSHTLTAVARDAAGNTATAPSVTVTVSNVTPSPTGQIDIPLKTWIKRPAPTIVGNTVTGPCPNGGCKHVRVAHNPDNGLSYFLGGDWSGPYGLDSGRNELYSYSIATDTWKLETPYCASSGIQPMHPDEVGWIYDSKRAVFWFKPGYQGLTDDCSPSGTLIYNERISFDPITKVWSKFGKPPFSVGETNKFMVYDPVTDQLIGFGGLSTPGYIWHYSFASDQWTSSTLTGANISDAKFNEEYAAIDVVGRHIWVIDPVDPRTPPADPSTPPPTNPPLQGRLYRYDIDTNTMNYIGRTPIGNYWCGDFNYCSWPWDGAMPIWDSVNKVLLWPHITSFTNGKIHLYIYHPNTNTWEADTANQSGGMTVTPDGVSVTGNTAVFDSQQNALLVMGASAPSQRVPYMFLYRYGNGSSTPSPDITPPAIPTNLTATAILSSQINLSWTTSTDNVGVTGYKIYRCSGSACAPTVQIATSTTNSYSNTGLIASTAYTYAVSAYDGAGNNSAKSSLVSATTQSLAPQCSDTIDNDNDGKIDYPLDPDCSSLTDNNESDTTPPTISSVISTTLASTTARIDWQTSEPGTSQVEYGFTTQYGASSTLDTTLTTSHSVSLSNLSPDNTTYNYRVRSKDSSGNESISTNNTFITTGLTDIIPPASTTNLTANNITQTSVDLVTWTAAGDDGNSGTASSFDIRYATGELSENTWNNSSVIRATGEPTPKIAGSIMNYTLVGLTPNTTYKVALKTLDEVPNQSLISNIITFTTVKAETTPAPAPTPTPAPAPSSGGGGGGGGGGGSTSSGGGSSSGGGGSSIISDTTPPPKITELKAQGADKQVRLTWKNPESSDWVRTILVRKAGGFATSTKDGQVVFEGTEHEFTDVNLKNNQNYYYSLFTIDRTPNYSKPATVMVKTIALKVSLEEIKPAQLTVREQEVLNLAGEAAEIIKSDIKSFLSRFNFKRDQAQEDLSLKQYIKELTKGLTDLMADRQIALNHFIAYGTATTLKLGAGERAGVVNSYKSAFNKLPETAEEWTDAIKIANGRWPTEISTSTEAKAVQEFKKVYKREPNRKNQHDDAAVTVMSYGLRPSNRNLNSEKAAIKSFRAIYGYVPISAVDWDIVRAIAYSGAKR